MKNQFDVIIVGAGPSGSALAYLLGRSGFKVLIIEKSKFPRDKPCGGGLTEKTLDLLKELDLYSPKYIIDKCNNIEIRKRNKQILLLNVPIFQTNRKIFDYYLLKRAEDNGVEIKWGRPNTLSMNGSIEVKVNGEVFNSKVLVGADGANSWVARNISNNYKKRKIGIAIKADIFNYNIDNCIFSFGYSSIGYAWAFPKDDMINVGIGGYKININLLYKFLSENKIKGMIKNFGGHILPVNLYFMRDRISFKNIILIGDAAGFIDALTGEGIYYAIKSSKIAFKAIKKAIYERSESLSLYYWREAKSLIEEINISRAISRLFYKNIKRSLEFACKNKKYISIIKEIAKRGYNRRLLIKAFLNGLLDYSRLFLNSKPFLKVF